MASYWPCKPCNVGVDGCEYLRYTIPIDDINVELLIKQKIRNYVLLVLPLSC
jgi:hypothetical protein